MPSLNELRHQANTIFLNEKTRDESLAQHLVALANGPGGCLVFGATAAGRPQAIKDPLALRDRLLELALRCEPPLIIPEPHLQLESEPPLVLVMVPPDLPHVYHFDGRYLVWQNQTLAPLDGTALRSLIFARGETGFESQPVTYAEMSDLDSVAIATYLDAVDALRHLPPEEALFKRGCIQQDRNGVWRPTQAGLLLFGRDPQQWLPQAQITIAVYPGLHMEDQFARAEVQGSLPEQARQAEAFLRRHMTRQVALNALQRQEQHAYPLGAVREMIVNALAHRDYSIRGDNIRLLLFANRLECYSPGRLPGHITVENIHNERFSRNAVLVQGLFDLGFIERLGYGINRIVAMAADEGLPEPHFVEMVAGFQVTLYGRAEGHYTPADGMRTWLEMGLNPRQLAVLNYLNEQDRITNADYQTLCPDVSSETLRRDLADLVERNVLLRIGEKRATFYILK